MYVAETTAVKRSLLFISDRFLDFKNYNLIVLIMNKFLVLAFVILLNGCAIAPNSQVTVPSQSVLAMAREGKVLEVETTGKENNYTFAVTISSPDTGCNSYADWWEVITPEGELLYRRVLLHSHVDEQPFSRTGGTVAIESQQPVVVRMHMSDTGYSPIAQQGTVKNGFSEVTLPADFAASLADVEPLPTNCAF